MTEVSDYQASAAAAEKLCGNPDCGMSCPADSENCWLCRFDFTTGRMPDETDPGAPSTVAAATLVADNTASTQLLPANAPIISNAGTATGEALSASAADGRAQPAGSDDEGRERSGPLDSTLAPGPVHPTHLAPPLVLNPDPSEDGEIVFDVAIGEDGLSPGSHSREAPATLQPETQEVTTSRQRFDIEPSAVSIPAMNIEHPPEPHIVVILDLEPRRSRPLSENLPPAREPMVILLTQAVHPFGRTVPSICLDFDRAASSIHGFFIRNKNGSYSLKDVSTNGTKVMGRYVDRDEPKPLSDSVVITLGVCTKIIYFAGTSSSNQSAQTS